jgi:hypothetical protein
MRVPSPAALVRPSCDDAALPPPLFSGVREGDDVEFAAHSAGRVRRAVVQEALPNGRYAVAEPGQAGTPRVFRVRTWDILQVFEDGAAVRRRVDEDDEVEFSTHGGLPRRGVVVFVQNDLVTIVSQGKKRPKFFEPHGSEIRRVFRGGVEVARLSWLPDRPGLTPDGVEKMNAALLAEDLRTAAEESVERARRVRALGTKEPTDPTFAYCVGDEVAYDGRGGAVRKGRVDMVLPASSEGGAPTLRVLRKAEGSWHPVYPRLERVRDVHREGVCVARRRSDGVL